MATKSDFTEDEWDAIRKGVTGAGLLVSLGDRDFTDTFGEAGALRKQLREEHEKSQSELVREIAAGHGSGFGLTTSPQKLETETLQALRSATVMLASKAPEELAAYKKLVRDVADAVASAKGGVKEGETTAIGKITEALGTS